MVYAILKAIFGLYNWAYVSFGHRVRRVPGILAIVNFVFRIASRLLPKTIDVRGSKMYTDPHEGTLFIAAALNRYDPFMTELFERVVKEGNTVIDLGANVGYYTLLASKIVGKRGRVYAFEPDPKSYKLLVKNIDFNNYSNIIPVPKAVTDRVGSTKLFLSPEPGADTLYADEGQQRFIEVETETLDHFFQDKGETVNVVKMDIEGGEMDALSGMDSLIRQNQNLNMFVEFFPRNIERAGYSPGQLLDKLWSYKFKVFVIDEWGKRLRYISHLHELMTACQHPAAINLFVTR